MMRNTLSRRGLRLNNSKRLASAGVGMEALESRRLMTAFQVTNTNDDGDGSLRKAILDANANAGADDVVFTGSTFTDATADTITLTTGQLSVFESVTITGTGKDKLTISGGDATRVFEFDSVGVTPSDSTISDLTITHGKASQGGGIFNAAKKLTLTRVVVSNSTAVDIAADNGGEGETGIDGGTNGGPGSPGFKSGFGGGIYTQGDELQLIDSTLMDNTATGGKGGDGGFGGNGGGRGGQGGEGGGGGAGLGGGIYVAKGDVKIATSTLSGNSATGGAGGESGNNGSPGDGDGGTGGGGGGGGRDGGTGGSDGDRDGTDGGFGSGGGGALEGGSSGTGGFGGGGGSDAPGGFGGGGGSRGFGGFGGGDGSGGDGGGGGAGIGGAIYLDDGSLTIGSSTLMGNSATGGKAGFAAGGGAGLGGAIFSNGATVGIANSTFTQNTVTGGADGGQGLGGAIFTRNGDLTIHSSTVSSNTADDARGLFTLADNAIFTVGVYNSIFGQADDSVADVQVEEIGSGSFTNIYAQNNLVRKPGTNDLNSISSADPKLGALADNGGPTKTFLPKSDSPAINAGADGAVPLELVFDQRGVGFPRKVGTVDIGSVEVQPVVGTTLSIADMATTEGNSGTKTLTFTILRDGDTTGTSKVHYATSNLTAGEGDYNAKSGDFTFTAGQTSKTFNVTIKGDTKIENDENFRVRLTSLVGATAPDNEALGTIINDDAPPPAKPIVSISDASIVEGNNGTRQMVFKVTLGKVSSDVVTVKYKSSNVTAGEGDYNAVSGTLTFMPGQTDVHINVTIKGDTKKEKDETFRITLSSAVNATIGDGEETGTIKNDD